MNLDQLNLTNLDLTSGKYFKNIIFEIQSKIGILEIINYVKFQ